MLKRSSRLLSKNTKRNSLKITMGMKSGNELKYRSPQIKYQGEIFEVIETPVLVGGKEKLFSKVRRAPGTRSIIVKNGRILLSKEYRHESNTTDWRLPGGKVFDTLEEYNKCDKSKILDYALVGAKKECEEEVGIKPLSISHFHTTNPTATVEWDLYYFIIDEFQETQQKLEAGEKIDSEWKSEKEVRRMCLNGEIGEERSALVLLRFLEISK